MNCENCKNLISSYIDGDLDAGRHEEIKAHLKMCLDCAKVHEDFSAILDFSESDFSEESTPPNPQALWCRINNIIETEIKPEMAAEAAAPAQKQSPVKRFFKNTWRFSPTQIVTAALGVALISSLLTVIGVKNFAEPGEIHTSVERQPNVFETMLSKIGVFETPQEKAFRRIAEQKSAIAYWEKRVEIRKAEWDAKLQNAFDRNLKEIDRVVNEYTKIVSENPQDKISSEMLDSALSEKMEFLRGFSEL